MHVEMIDSICHTHTVWTSLPRPQPSKILQIVRYQGMPSMHVEMIDSICHTHTVWTSLPRPQSSKILQIPRNTQHARQNDWQHMPHPYSLNESASSSTFKDPPDTQEFPACMSISTSSSFTSTRQFPSHITRLSLEVWNHWELANQDYWEIILTSG